MSKPQIIIEDYQGQHNSSLGDERNRLIRGGSYKDQSTIMVVPTRGMIPARVVQSWMGLLPPMNQKFIRIFLIGMEVGEAYTHAVEVILSNPELSSWKYMLTVEEDNLPPPDGFLMLLESIEKYDVVGGLYWTKGEGGQPMIYGDPKAIPKGFQPQVPIPDTVQECNGLGMGFNLFKIEMFKKMKPPYFKTLTEYIPGQGAKVMTQDLQFYAEAAKLGFRFACDTRVRVGHLDVSTDIVW